MVLGIGGLMAMERILPAKLKGASACQGAVLYMSACIALICIFW